VGVAIDVIRVACNTSSGTQNITGDVGALTPKAALFILSAGITDGTAAADAFLSFGFADGTNRYCIGFHDSDNLATTSTKHWYENDEVIQVYDGSDTLICEADFTSWLTDGVQINWATAPGSAYLLTVILFAGSDLSAHVNYAQISATVDTPTDVTDPGFEPDVVIAITSGQLWPAQTGDNAEFSLGFVHNDGASGITQRSANWMLRDGLATTDVKSYVEDSGGAQQCSWFGNAQTLYVDFEDFDSGGFSITPRTAGGNRRIAYLALSMGGAVSSWVGTYSTPTSTGSDSETGPAFTPQAVLALGTMMESFDSFDATALSGARMVAAWDANDQYAVSANCEDNVATSNTQSLSDDVAIELPDDDGAAGLTASFTSFDANGWTLNYSAVEATAKLFLALAIGAEAAAGNPWHAYAQQ